MNRPHADLSPNLSPARREALIAPLPYEGRDWGLGLIFVV
jgi:hypothetical protein